MTWLEDDVENKEKALIECISRAHTVVFCAFITRLLNSSCFVAWAMSNVSELQKRGKGGA